MKKKKNIVSILLDTALFPQSMDQSYKFNNLSYSTITALTISSVNVSSKRLEI